MNNKIVLIALLMSLATVTVLSIEEQAQAESIVGNFADGYEYGKEVGEEESEND
jgi:hypothetical protein